VPLKRHGLLPWGGMLNDRRYAVSESARSADLRALSAPDRGRFRKIVSWNLLRRTGAKVDSIVELVLREQPDLLLMQEATKEIASIKERLGGDYAWAPLPGRIHGLAMWSPVAWAAPPIVIKLPSGALVDRVCQILDMGDFGVANVHLSHGQVLNRRQLRRIEQSLPARAAVIGDYNLIGPALLPGFRDAGPRIPTHAMVDLVPLRIDRCLVRGLACLGRTVLPRGASDHRPIVVHLAPAPAQPTAHDIRGMAALVARLRRAAGREATAAPVLRTSGAPPSSSA
jgi:endonuclease/exonuclease/phosphatase (EEP) superfamily protein YafD